MTIHMKRRDVWFGVRKSPARCPVARALNRATGDRWAVYDGCAMKMFERPIRLHPLPELVTRFVRGFDSGATVTPLSFEFHAA